MVKQVSAKEQAKTFYYRKNVRTLRYKPLLPPMHSAAIVMKECDAYGEVTITGTDHIYATPHVHTTPQ